MINERCKKNVAAKLFLNIFHYIDTSTNDKTILIQDNSNYNIYHYYSHSYYYYIALINDYNEIINTSTVLCQYHFSYYSQNQSYQRILTHDSLKAYLLHKLCFQVSLNKDFYYINQF